MMYPLYDINFFIDSDARAGGTHVTNVSAVTSCSNKLNKGMIGSCSTHSLEQVEHTRIMVSPNPFSNEINIEFETEIMSGSAIIFDANGRIIQKQKLHSNLSRIDTSKLGKGIYFLNVTSGDQFANYKIVKL